MNAVKVKTYTWAKDSHKLFDYECPNLHQNEFTSNDSLVIARSNNQIIFHDPSRGELPTEQTPLCTLKKSSDGRFLLSSASPVSPIKLVVRSLKSDGKQNGYELRVGDKIQIGRVEFLIREMKDEDNNLFRADFSEPLSSRNEMEIEQQPQESRICRICLEEEEVNGTEDHSRVFISPCNCKGSSKYVHVECLKSWVKCKKLENRRSQFPHPSNFMGLIYYLSGNEVNYITRLTNQPHFRALLSNWYSNQPEASGMLPGLSSPSNQFFIPLANLAATLEGSNTNIPESPSRNDQLPENNSVQSNSTEQFPFERPVQPPNSRVISDGVSLASPIQKNSESPKAPEQNVENNFFSNFACDVCKEILPFTVKLDGQCETEIASIARPEKLPYVILEKVSQGKESKVFSVIKGIENSEIRLGRGHICDLPIPDISVSRCHALIRYQKGRFMLFDNNSKFGTLVSVTKEIELHRDKLGFQSGRTLITISTKLNKQSRQSEELEKLDEIAPSVDGKSLAYIRRSGHAKKRKLDKRVQSKVKMPRKQRAKDEECETIEGESPKSRFPEVNSRSKKILKRN